MVAVSLKKDFFQAEDGIRDHGTSRGLGDVYKRQVVIHENRFGSEAATSGQFVPPEGSTVMMKTP